MWLIIKHITNSEGKTLPVIMLNGIGEVLEFETEQEARDFASILQINTDSGWKYVVTKIGK